LGLKTEAVRRLIEADYVGRRQERLLIEGEETKQLNPSVIMDMRHKMVNLTYKLYFCIFYSYTKLKSLYISYYIFFLSSFYNKFVISIK